MAARSRINGGNSGGWKQDRAAEAPPSRRWQGAADGTAGVLPKSRESLRHQRIGIAFVLAAAAFALFLYWLLYRPARTPFLYVGSAEYVWPVPPTAWVAEDLDRFQALSGENISVVDLSDASKSKDTLTARIDQQLRRLPPGRMRQVPAVVYLALQGMVDANGRPCVLPASASPLREEEWLPVETVLDTVRDTLPAETLRLIVLDSQKFIADWRLGVIYNDFAERVRELVDSKSWPNTTVILSASPGQMSWTSGDLQGSNFAHFFSLGLAGDADDGAVGGTGDGDGRVTVSELSEYVRKYGSDWSRRNRVAEQTPLVLPDSAPDFRVGWRLNRWTLRRLRRDAFRRSPAEVVVTADGLTRIWERIQRLAEQDIQRWDPLSWHHLRQEALWLEQLASAGRAYQARAKRTLDELDADLNQIESQIAATADKSRAITSRWNALTTLEDRPIADLPTHGFDMGVYTGRVKTSDYEALNTELSAAVDAGDANAVTQSLDRIKAAAGSQLADRTYSLRALDGIDGFNRWSGQLPWGSIWRTRQLLDLLSVPWSGDPLPGDERVNSLSKSMTSRANRLRRAAEDRLFAVNVADVDDTLSAWNSAEREADSARRVRDNIASMLRIRDTAAGELGDLAQWSLREHRLSSVAKDRGSDGQSTPATTEVGRIVRACSLLNELGQGLGAASITAESMVPLNDIARGLEAEHAELNKTFRDAWEGLLESHTADGSAWRMFDDVLSCPLIPAVERVKLRSERDELSARMHDAYASDWDELVRRRTAGEEPPTRPNVAIPDSTFRRDMASWTTHPLMIMTGIPSLETQDAASQTLGNPGLLDRIQGDVRRALLDVATWEPADLSLEEGSGAPRSVRERISAVEHRFRVARPISGILPEYDAVRFLRRFDLQDLFLWQAEEALEDFYGPNHDMGRTRGEPMFVAAAVDYLRAARDVLEPLPETETKIAAAQAVLDQRREGMRSAVESWADAPLADGLETPQALVTVRAGPTASSLPNGGAGIHVRRDDGHFDEVRVSRDTTAEVSVETSPTTSEGDLVSLPMKANESLRFRLTWGGPTETTSSREVLLFFRGHAFATPVVLPRIGGIVVDYRPRPPRPPRVTLYGDQRQPLSTLFILDCSASMERPLPHEQLGGGERPRLDAAKAALVSSLIDLSERPNERVGVRLFGHRMGWSTTPPLRVLPQTDYAGEIDPDLRPSEDVESILPLGRFGSIEAGGVIRRLESVRAWGQSPLYYALAGAMDEFSRENPLSRKGIVVITDGENYQFSPPNADDRDPPATTIADVIAAWETARVPIHILWFGDESGSEGERLAELRSLAERTGGSAMLVQSGGDLLRQLRDRLAEATYTVRDQNGVPTGVSLSGPSEPARLNTPVEITPTPERPADYSVVFGAVQKEVTLEGGESIALRLTADASDIVAESDQRQVAAERPLLVGAKGDYSGHSVRVYQPLRVLNAVRFQVALRADGLYYTPRPAEAWIEVVPLREGRADANSTYTFYDRRFAPDASLPTFEWEATNWPADATSAHVRVWFNPRPTPPSLRIPCAEILESPEHFASIQPFANDSSLRYRIQTRGADATGELELSVIESYTNPVPGVNSVRTSLSLPPGMFPTRVIHRFDSENNLALHTFVIPPSARPALGNPAAAIDLTRREDIQRAAWQLENDLPLLIEIPSGSNLLPTP